MTTRRLAPLVLVLSILALAGCSGSGTPAVTRTVTPSPISSSATPSYDFPAKGPEPYPGFCEDAQEYINTANPVGELIAVDLQQATDPGDLDSIHSMGAIIADSVDDATAVLQEIEAKGNSIAVEFASRELAAIPLSWGSVADLAQTATDVAAFQADLASLMDSSVFMEAWQGSGEDAEYWNMAEETCYLAG